MHRRDLVKKGYRHGMIGRDKKQLQEMGKNWKAKKQIKSYRVVKEYDGRYELYVNR
jgi:hypothetical protein